MRGERRGKTNKQKPPNKVGKRRAIKGGARVQLSVTPKTPGRGCCESTRREVCLAAPWGAAPPRPPQKPNRTSHQHREGRKDAGA